MSKSIRIKGTSVGASLLAMLTVGLASADAAGIPVIDVPHTIQSTLNQINTYSQRLQDAREYGENTARWMSALNHYRQQLVRIQGAVMGFGLPQGQDIPKVDANYMVAERCGQGVSFGGLAQAVRLNGSGDLIEQQKQLCASIQRMRNAKYNYTVEFFQDYMPKLEGELDRLATRRNSSNEEGNVAASDNDALRFGNEADANFQAWQSKIQAYEAYIVAMEANQKLLARMAMKGSGAIGTLVNTAALKDALETDE